MMFPTIDKKSTGINLRKMMDERDLSVKDVQQYLGLGSIQSVYHWLNGLSMPTIDNLYALSHLFRVSIDEMICGNKYEIKTRKNCTQSERLSLYCDKFDVFRAA